MADHDEPQGWRERLTESAPAIWMDQLGNYWRVYPGHPDPAQVTLSMPQVSDGNYQVEPIAIYRQGRDLSAAEMEALRTRIHHATDDDLLKRIAQSAWHAFTTGRDMVTEAELLMQAVAIRLDVTTPVAAHGPSRAKKQGWSDED